MQWESARKNTYRPRNMQSKCKRKLKTCKQTVICMFFILLEFLHLFRFWMWELAICIFGCMFPPVFLEFGFFFWGFSGALPRRFSWLPFLYFRYFSSQFYSFVYSGRISFCIFWFIYFLHLFSVFFQVCNLLEQADTAFHILVRQSQVKRVQRQ